MQIIFLVMLLTLQKTVVPDAKFIIQRGYYRKRN